MITGEEKESEHNRAYNEEAQSSRLSFGKVKSIVTDVWSKTSCFKYLLISYGGAESYFRSNKTPVTTSTVGLTGKETKTSDYQISYLIMLHYYRK